MVIFKFIKEFLGLIRWKKFLWNSFKLFILSFVLAYALIKYWYIPIYNDELLKLAVIEDKYFNMDVFDLNTIEEGRIIYIHGIPEHRNEGLTSMDSIGSRYDFFHVGIYSYEKHKVYRYQIPVYAKSAFQLGSVFQQTKEKKRR